MPHPAYSPESAHCASVKPNRLLESSSAAGWTSLRLDHHEGAGQSEIFDTHPTSDLTLVIAMAGRHQLDVLSQGRWRSAQYSPGSAGMTPPDDSARLRWRTPSPDQPFRTLHIYLPGALVADLADEYRRAGQTVRVSDMTALAFRDPAITVHAEALLAASRSGEADLYAAGAARWLVTHLLSQQAHWRHLADDPRLATITDRRLARVIEYMSVHLDRVLTLDDLACEAGMSVHHFGRRFRESTGMGPAAYLATLRIARARLLLRTTDLSVAEVGVQSGYSTASAFATAFLRQVGTTPTKYRASA